MLARTVLGALAVAAVGAGAMKMSPAELRERQRAAVKRMQHERALSPAVKRAVPQNITFSDPRASGKSPLYRGQLRQLTSNANAETEYYVDGTIIPEVDFDVGPSWSGILPISSDPNEERQV